MTMAHEELKALYEIDRQHSDTPGQYWDLKTCNGEWVDAHEPAFVSTIEYRRKPDAPVWTKSPKDQWHENIENYVDIVQAEDARKWRDLVREYDETNEARAMTSMFDAFKKLTSKNSTPQLIQGYTAEQWQTIIDGKFLCEFSDREDFTDRIIHELDSIGDHVFRSNECGWTYCRPLRTKGVRQPWFGGECPVNGHALVSYTLRDGHKEQAEARMLLWGNTGAPWNVTEFIEL